MKKELINKTEQTPIEIALQIDENGMTTASNLYRFLELDMTHFSRWCRKNIINNKFASVNEDYFVLATDGENYTGRPKTDYKITSDFAKKLSMTGNTERHEQARQYFIACEQGLKIATEKLNTTKQIDLSPITEALTNISVRLSALEESQTKHKQLPKSTYSRWKAKAFEKMKLLQSYVSENSDQELTLADVSHVIMNEIQDTYDIDLNEYRDMYKCEFDLDGNPYPLDYINHYKDIRDMFNLTIDSIMEQLHIPMTSKATENIFDVLIREKQSMAGE